jgi:ABC-type glycerol-3-phosphate transport system permease component
MAQTEPMLGVNLGTRGPHEAREYIEYCNLNTILVSAVITVVSISCALMCAYALSRIEFRGKFLINWSIIWSMAIVTFIGAWNNFFWPFIVTNSTPMLTIPVGMTRVQSAFAKTSAIAVLASIPTVVGYLIFQKRVTQGVMASAGIKGSASISALKDHDGRGLQPGSPLPSCCQRRENV